jgi:hypothetical protein
LGVFTDRTFVDDFSHLVIMLSCSIWRQLSVDKNVLKLDIYPMGEFQIRDACGWAKKMAIRDGDTWLVPNDPVLAANTVEFVIDQALAVFTSSPTECRSLLDFVGEWCNQHCVGDWAWVTPLNYITFREASDAVKFTLVWS